MRGCRRRTKPGWNAINPLQGWYRRLAGGCFRRWGAHPRGVGVSHAKRLAASRVPTVPSFCGVDLVLLPRAGVRRLQSPPKRNRIVQTWHPPVTGSVCDTEGSAFRIRGSGGRIDEARSMIALVAQGRCAPLRMHARRGWGKFGRRFGAHWRGLLEFGGNCAGAARNYELRVRGGRVRRFRRWRQIRSLGCAG